MELKSIRYYGKRKITLIIKSSGVDKTREAALLVMGPGFRYKTEDEIKERDRIINDEGSTSR